MKLVFYSSNGQSAGMAYRAMLDNHESYLLIKNELYSDIMEGIVNKLYTLSDINKIKPDIVIFDDVGMAEDAIKLQKLGIKTLNTSPTIDKFAVDYELCLKIAKDLKLNVDNGEIEGIEVSVDMAFQDGNPLFPATSTLKSRHFLAGDMGLYTNCQASLTWGYNIKEPRLVQLFKKFWPLLYSIGYTGYFGIKVVIDNRGKIWFRDFNRTLDFNAIYGVLGLLDMDMADYLWNMANGRLHAIPIRLNEYSYAVNLSVYPYPCQSRLELQRTKLLPINFPEKYYADVWLLDVMRADDRIVCAGNTGHIATVTSCGKETYKLDNSVKAIVNDIDLLGKQYRNDSIYYIMSDYSKLKKRGII